MRVGTLHARGADRGVEGHAQTQSTRHVPHLQLRRSGRLLCRSGASAASQPAPARSISISETGEDVGWQVGVGRGPLPFSASTADPVRSARDSTSVRGAAGPPRRSEKRRRRRPSTSTSSTGSSAACRWGALLSSLTRLAGWKALPGLTSAKGRPGGQNFAQVNKQSALRLHAAQVSRRQRRPAPLRPAGRAGRCLCPQLRVLCAAKTSCSAAESCACTRTMAHALLLQRALLDSRQHMLVESDTQHHSPYRGSTPYAQAAVGTEFWRNMRLNRARLHSCCISDGGDSAFPSSSNFPSLVHGLAASSRVLWWDPLAHEKTPQAKAVAI